MNKLNLKLVEHLIDRKPRRIAAKVKPAAERKINIEHPWIFKDSIIKLKKDCQNGDLVIIYDSKKNNFLAGGLYDNESDINIKLLIFKKQEIINQDWFTNRIKIALEKRTGYFKENTNSYRVIFGENDGLPSLILDKYDQVLVLKIYSEIWFPYLSILLEAIIGVLIPKSIILRFNRKILKRHNDLRDGMFVYGEEINEVCFLENGIKIQCNLIKGHKTGFFLDHRLNRIEIAKLSFEKNVLDVFSYIGGFAVHALTGGANKVTSIDISRNALNQAYKNAELNKVASNYDTMNIDALEGMILLKERKQKFDLVIVDPPSMASSKSQIVKAIHSYKVLIDHALPLVTNGGVLLFCSCSSRIKKDEFVQMVLDQLAFRKTDFEVIKITGHDVDHPIKLAEMEYLKSIYLKINN